MELARVPALQAEHTVLALAEMYPNAQGTHMSPCEDAKVPAKHLEQACDASDATYPASHKSQYARAWEE